MAKREEWEAEPIDVWKIKGFLFETFDQGGGECAVRVKRKGRKTFWLEHPEKHYETEAGARYAILTFLQDL